MNIKVGDVVALKDEDDNPLDFLAMEVISLTGYGNIAEISPLISENGDETWNSLAGRVFSVESLFASIFEPNENYYDDILIKVDAEIQHHRLTHIFI